MASVPSRGVRPHRARVGPERENMPCDYGGNGSRAWSSERIIAADIGGNVHLSHCEEKRVQTLWVGIVYLGHIAQCRSAQATTAGTDACPMYSTSLTLYSCPDANAPSGLPRLRLHFPSHLSNLSSRSRGDRYDYCHRRTRCKPASAGPRLLRLKRSAMALRATDILGCLLLGLPFSPASASSYPAPAQPLGPRPTTRITWLTPTLSATR